MKILMIEDQSYFSGMMVGMLEGLDIDVAESLAEAKERLRIQKYDMMLVDLGLPDSRGIDTLRALKEYKIPKVVLTGQFDLSKDAMVLCDDFIVKSDPSAIYERIIFNATKIQRVKKPRFSTEAFEQIRACFDQSNRLELTMA